MKLRFSLIVCHYFLFVGVIGRDFEAGIAELRSLLGIADNVTLVPTVIASGAAVPYRGCNDVSGNTVIRFELRGNSLPVYDAGVTAEFFPNGTYADLWTSRGEKIILNDNGEPSISPGRALFILAQKFNLCRQISSLQHKQFSPFYLVDPVTNVGRLIYHGSFVYYGQVTSCGTGTTETIRPTALIDANTGEVIQSWNGVSPQFPTRTVRAYGGNVGDVLGKLTYPELVVGLQADGRCIYSTPEVQVQNMNRRTNGDFSATRFVCNAPRSDKYDNANGGYSPLNDAMSNAQTTVNMFRTYVNGINQSHFELPLKLRVHFGVNYDNAFWDGTYASFGDGSSSVFYPLVTLDNVAHELAHGFTSHRSGSNLENLGEAGGINEAFSDMSGQAAVFYSGRTPTMTPGVEFRKTGEPLRDMCNPRSDGRSIGHYSEYTSDLDPHYSSGLYNKAYCILSQRGGSWNIGSTFRVFAYANRMYWRQKTSFNEGVCGVQKAANFSLGPSAVVDVIAAFQEVGLSCVR